MRFLCCFLSRSLFSGSVRTFRALLAECFWCPPVSTQAGKAGDCNLSLTLRVRRRHARLTPESPVNLLGHIMPVVSPLPWCPTPGPRACCCLGHCPRPTRVVARGVGRGPSWSYACNAADREKAVHGRALQWEKKQLSGRQGAPSSSKQGLLIVPRPAPYQCQRL